MFEAKYISVDERRETFKNFPHGEIYGYWLAEAGFIYLPNQTISKTNDVCECYRCGQRIHEWIIQHDDPRTEHDRFSPNCKNKWQEMLDGNFGFHYYEPDTPLWVHKKCDIESEIKGHQLIIDELKKSGIKEEAEPIQIEKAIIKSLEEEITRIRIQNEEERASNRCSHYSKYVKSLLSDKHNNIITWSVKSTEQWEVFVTEVYSRIDHNVIDKWFDTLRHQLDTPDVIPSFYTQTNVGEKNTYGFKPNQIQA